MCANPGPPGDLRLAMGAGVLPLPLYGGVGPPWRAAPAPPPAAPPPAPGPGAAAPAAAAAAP
eukprot:1610264-Lingulodinium_polyedra.AAC.1